MVILDVPFTFNRDEFDKRVKIELYEGMEEEIESLLDKAVPMIKPKAVYRETGVRRREKGEGRQEGGRQEEGRQDKGTRTFKILQLDNQTFTDPVLVDRLKDVPVVFPYVVTCGDELEELSGGEDMLVTFWLDALKQMAMDRAFNFFRTHIKENFNINKLYSLNPGSNTCGEGWDIKDQKKLFSFFPDVEEQIGVRLTDSMLMSPNKTVSGIMFESDKDFVSCQECENIHCTNRKIIHEGALYS